MFTGIGGFDLAFQRVGIEVVAQIEIDPACQELLKSRFDIPLWKDVRDVRGRDLPPADLLVGGFPCQGLSIAGQKDGFRDPRTQLFWEFVRLAREKQVRWVLIENVTGLLSSGGRRDMGAVLGALAELGMGYAWRVLDASGFGVPQRRRRVFIVGRAGGSADGPREVLFEPEGGPGDSPSRRRPPEVIAALTASGLGGGGPGQGGVLPRRASPRASKPLAFTNQAGKTNLGLSRDISPPVTASHGNPPHVVQGYVVRKLTPLECERLQGFPDRWTEGFSDTVRYRMLGNAVCVPVAEWIAKRLLEVAEWRMNQQEDGDG